MEGSKMQFQGPYNEVCQEKQQRCQDVFPRSKSWRSFLPLPYGLRWCPHKNTIELFERGDNSSYSAAWPLSSAATAIRGTIPKGWLLRAVGRAQNNITQESSSTCFMVPL